MSGFKPGSTLSDPGWGQPMSLGPLGWSIMSLDGLVHPQKICPSVSNMSTQSLVGLPTYRTSHSHNIHLDTSQAYWLNPMADHHQMHPLKIMHDHPDFMTDLGSHLCTRWPTSVLVCI